MIDNKDAFGEQHLPGWRKRPGRASLNRALAALAVAAAGYILGFVITWGIGSGQGTIGQGLMFFPLGGFASLLLAVFAIYVGVRVRRFADNLSDIRRQRLEAFMDVENERRLASLGVVLGVISIAVNPLIAYAIISILRLR